ncbi:carotenoid oxygenase family protein [Mycolicibacter heraklionensis]|uniref:Dioxygenase n=1 Tax=Mycolicibacter heraklionensis TaxID=512402 RepID=A0A9X7WHQ2_9MYCO|nr:carotenoid oxygenase family protein [Mycolicibacter heraklionensis]
MGRHHGENGGQWVIIDAATGASVVTVHLPQRAPTGFHGNWTPVD